MFYIDINNNYRHCFIVAEGYGNSFIFFNLIIKPSFKSKIQYITKQALMVTINYL